MLEFDEARERLLDAARCLGPERVNLRSAMGRVLAEDIVAPEPLPRFDHSAMDGYAVRASDLQGTGPWQLQVTGESRAGGHAGELAPGTAHRIFTGARLPAGADSVILQENTTNAHGALVTAVAVRQGQNIRLRGEDIADGDLVLTRGTRLNGFHLGLAASVDRAELAVTRRPRVTVISTGDELRLPGQSGPAGTIPESNAIAITALAEATGASVTLAPLPGDDPQLGRRVIGQAIDEADLVVTIGGVSVGAHDWVKEALSALDVKLEFWKLNIRPGKPLAFGSKGRVLLLGLPGNPVSAQLTFTLLGLPLLRAMAGEPREPLPRLVAALTTSLAHHSTRRGFYRALLGADGVTPLGNQASGNTASLARANALIDVAADTTELPAGSRVDVLPLHLL